MKIRIFSENGEKLSDKEFNASNRNHKFIEIDNSDQLKYILKEISEHDGEKDFTIACPKRVDPQYIQEFNVNDVTIIFTDKKYDPNNEENRKEFRDLITKTDILYRNKNFVGEDVIIHKEVAEEIQSRELLAAAYKFIAFEYRNENDNTIKPKYDELELKKIHSSFEDTDKNELIEKARDAVCGGKYDIIKFNQAKKESIYNGVDKFKASIDGDGYLVIQSVAGGTIKDEHFQEGVKTNFKFEGRGGTEVTQDNLRKLFTNGSHGKDSGLSLLGAIEQSFQALKTIEKDNNGKLINPKSSEEFNAIFPEYGATLRVQPTLAFSEAGAEAPPLPPPAAVPPAPAPGGAGSATVPAAEEAEAAPKVKVAAPAPEAAAPTGAPAVGAPPTDTVSEAAAPPAATVPETPGYLGLIRRAAVVAAATAKAAAPEETPAPEELAEGARQTVSTTPMLEERLKRASEPEAGAPGSEEATAPAAPPPPPAGTPSTSLEGPAVAEEVLLTTARQATL